MKEKSYTNELNKLNSIIDFYESSSEYGNAADGEVYSQYIYALRRRTELLASRNLKKRILVISGSASVGKDTFASILSQHVSVRTVHIADKAKKVARSIGWNGKKDEKGRKLLSDLKIAIDEFDDGCYKYVCNESTKFIKNLAEYRGIECLCIMMREPKDISRFVQNYNAVTVCVINRQKSVPHNIGDESVGNYEYDHIIDNSHSLKKFEDTISDFYKSVFKEN